MSDLAIRPVLEAVTGSDERSADAEFDALSNERRRRVLSVLSAVPTPIDVAALARTVAAREIDTRREAVSDERLEKVHAALYHVHLPKLADADLVEYDCGARTVGGVADGFESLSP